MKEYSIFLRIIQKNRVFSFLPWYQCRYAGSASRSVILLQISVVNNWNWYMGDFFESFAWSSMDHSEDNLKTNYLIFKINCFKKKIITTSFFNELS
jgi:hypothetical protein